MKKIVLILILLVPILLSAQTKVAVYVTATESVPKETKKIIGSEVVAAFVATKEYNAIERTVEFLSEISKEQDYQRGGNVDDSQICELGRQFGVDLVCVTDITKFQEKFYVQARLIDVEKAIVLATAREIAQLEDLDAIMKLASSLAQSLINADVTYVLKVENTQTVPLEIFVNNEVVGQVPPKSTRTFDMPISKIGKIEAKPTKGLFKKTMENTINKMKAQDTVSFAF
ncbi:MAG: hypothetical protein J6Y35_03225 [Bacteroidales bacterium]|nr:hypothetical protein [Bacteroidales bacterium]